MKANDGNAISLTIPTVGDLPVLKQIYMTAFPPEERREWPKIVSPDQPGQPLLRAIYLGNKPIGLITCWDFTEFIYIEHFAIDDTMRGSGIGSQVINQMKESELKPLLLEAEPPTVSNQAKRRIAFYQRLGFDVIDRDYIQPPYSSALPSVALWLMSTGQIESRHTTDMLHRHVYQTENI